MREICNILLVEDEVIARQALRYIIGLEPENYEIVGEASNGEEALALLEKHRPHVIICDIVMPIMNGIELIKMVNLRYPDIFIIVLSGHDKFDLVKSAFQFGVTDYILKPRLEPRELLDKLHELSTRLGIPLRTGTGNGGGADARILKRMLEERDRELESESAPMPGVFPHSHFLLMACDIKGISSVHSNQNEGALQIIRSNAEQLLAGVSYLETTHRQGTMWVLLANVESEEASEVCNRLQLLTEQVAQAIPSIFFVRTVPYGKPEDTRLQFRRIQHQLELRFYYPSQHISICAPTREQTSSAVLHRKTFIEAVRAGSMELAEKELLRYLKQAATDRSIPETELKKTVEFAIYSTINLLEDTHYPVDDLNREKLALFSAIDGCSCMEELTHQVSEAFRIFRHIIGTHAAKEGDQFQRIQDYIDSNYSKPLSLAGVAEQFHISYSYLSYFFNHYSGQGFNEYLNSVRIERAKDLLRTTNHSLAEISAMVGYSEQSYFGKVFKKLNGCSPSGYRKRHTVSEKS